MSSENGFAKPDELFSKSSDRVYQEVEIMGYKFLLRSWTTRELESYNSEGRKKGNEDNGNVRMIQKTCVDKQTKDLLFSKEDLSKLRDMDAGFTVRLAEACMQHIGLRDPEEEPEGN